MSELLEPFDRLLADLFSPPAIRAIEAGGDWRPAWDAIEQSGFLDALVREEAGGFGLALAEVAPLLTALGAYAAPLPVGETMIARALLGEQSPAGSIALASGTSGGEAVVSGGLVCDRVLLEAQGGLALVAAADADPQPTGVHGSLAARMRWPETHVIAAAPVEGGLAALAALVKSAAIAGAGERVLAMCADYANTRVQFGKAIGRQQAVQQQLAVMAEDVVACRLAVQLACAGSFPPARDRVAAAKVVAGAAAARIAAIAHAVHGAIGISAEHDLQLYTRRLHEWRLADGGEGVWGRALGRSRLASDAATSVDWVRAALFG
jgi:alkylation response protein AidB-like acyl-CoA dehydrogenase